VKQVKEARALAERNEGRKSASSQEESCAHAEAIT
jgi:hypothetical protein